jgi:hypothetical protein
MQARHRVIGMGTAMMCLAMSAGLARANLVANFQSAVLGGGGSDWTYSVSLDAVQRVDNVGPPSFANFVTVYDFGAPGTVSLGARTGALTTWLPTFALTNTAAFQTTPTDNATLQNFRLTAPPNTVGAVGPSTLGTFTLHSTLATIQQRTVSNDGQAFQITAPAGQHGNVGSTVAPVPGPLAGAGIPGMILLGSGLVALARRRRRTAA